MKAAACVGGLMAMAFWSQSDAAAQPDTHLIVVATTSLATAVAYCRTKHGDFDNADGKQCFLQARDVLAKFPFDERATRLREECPLGETFSTCLTPAVSRHTAELVQAFKSAGL